MYKEFFGLHANPFNATPDPRYLFLTKHTEEALACLTYGIEGRKGFVLLTGEVGTGKTTLVNKVLERLRHKQISTAFIFNPRLEVLARLLVVVAPGSVELLEQEAGPGVVRELLGVVRVEALALLGVVGDELGFYSRRARLYSPLPPSDQRKNSSVVGAVRHCGRYAARGAGGLCRL